MNHQMFNVNGMTCENCVRKITDTLKPDNEIKNLHVTLNPPQIHFDSERKFSTEEINQNLAPLGKYSAIETVSRMAIQTTLSETILKYMPLVILFAFSAGISAINVVIGRSDFDHWMYQFMGGTLIALSYFKLIDLPKFADAFSTYDPIAMKVYKYGYIYPFFELIVGVGFILSLAVVPLSFFVILFLLPTTIGIIKALSEKRNFQCACLGTAFNLPLTKVTIVENLLMIAMSVMIIL